MIYRVKRSYIGGKPLAQELSDLGQLVALRKFRKDGKDLEFVDLLVPYDEKDEDGE